MKILISIKIYRICKPYIVWNYLKFHALFELYSLCFFVLFMNVMLGCKNVSDVLYTICYVEMCLILCYISCI